MCKRAKIHRVVALKFAVSNNFQPLCNLAAFKLALDECSSK